VAETVSEEVVLPEAESGVPVASVEEPEEESVEPAEDSEAAAGAGPVLSSAKTGAYPLIMKTEITEIRKTNIIFTAKAADFFFIFPACLIELF
jgi:hypothetical protein